MMNRLEMRWLDDFICLAKVRHFTRAADIRNVTQPQFSRRIRQLEGDVGVDLIDRSSTPLQLTPAGEYFVDYAKRCIAEYESVRQQCNALASESSAAFPDTSVREGVR